MLDLANQEATKLDVEAKYGAGARPCVMKAHPIRQGILAVGMDNGEVVFVNYSNLHTLSIALSEKARNYITVTRNEDLSTVSIKLVLVTTK